MNSIHIALLHIVILFISCITTNNDYNYKHNELEELHWAKRVCLSAEYGRSANRILKWNHPVTVSVIKGESSSDLIDIVNTLNRVFNDTDMCIELLDSPNSNADIEVYFTELKNFTSIARQKDFTYAEGNWGYVYCFWNQNFELTKAYILIAIDKLEGIRLRHFIVEEFVQSFGLLNDSRTFTDSIFYSGNEYDMDNYELSYRDKKLINFLYKYLNNGATKKHFEDMYHQYWNIIEPE